MKLQQIEERLDWLQHYIGNLVHSKINNAFGGNMRALTFDEFLHCKGLDELVFDDTGFIPDMTDPMGKYWTQPHHNQITFRDGFAEMNKYSFDLLPQYDSTFPTGAYLGKMWKRLEDGKYYLVWYAKHENPDRVNIKFKPIKVVNPNYLYMYDKQRTLIIEGQVDDFEYYVKLQEKQRENLLKAHYQNK